MDTADRVSPLHRSDPDRLGAYRLTGRLGAGGMGVVYLALDPEGEYVAVKLVHSTLAYDPEFRARFRSEVERARQVPSFCTAEVLDADLDHSPPYLVVEYVDGPSLAEVVADGGPLRANNLHSVAVGVATALTGIHGAGVIHRDLKPENVLLAPGSPKVIDFGIARAFEATSQYTKTDQMVGTVAYMAPERFSSRPGTDLTAAADIFAWGCVVGYAGTGQTPFHGDSPPATAARILTQPPHLDGMAQPLRGLVELALAKEPEDRPTAHELLDMLLGDRPVPRRAAAPPPRTAAPDRRDLLQPAFEYDYDDEPLRPAPAAGRPHSTANTRWLAVLAVLLVLAGIATVVAVLKHSGVAGDALVSGAGATDGGRAAGAVETDRPAARATTTAPAAPAPTRVGSRPATPPPARATDDDATPVEPTGGRVLLQDPLSAPGRWLASADRARGARCVVQGVLQASLAGPGAFACSGPRGSVADDFGVAVSTALRSAGSCAAIWFHGTGAGDGQLLTICQDAMTVSSDRPGDRQTIGTVRLDRPIPLSVVTRVHLVVRDGRAELYRSGTFAGAVPLPDGGADEGRIQLGIVAGAADDPPPYAVTFGNVDIRAL